MQVRYLLLGVLGFVSSMAWAVAQVQTSSGEHIAIVSNQITVDPIAIQAGGQHHVGQVRLQLKFAADFNLARGEYAPALHPLQLNSGDVYVKFYVGSWRMKALPKTCQVTVPLGSMLIISGHLKASGVFDGLGCRMGRYQPALAPEMKADIVSHPARAHAKPRQQVL